MIAWAGAASRVLPLGSLLTPMQHREGLAAVAVQAGTLHGAVGWVCIWLAGGWPWAWLVAFELWLCWVALGWHAARILVALHDRAGRAPSVTWHIGQLLRTVQAVVAQFVAPCCIAAVAFSSSWQLVSVCAVGVGVGVGLIVSGLLRRGFPQCTSGLR